MTSTRKELLYKLKNCLYSELEAYFVALQKDFEIRKISEKELLQAFLVFANPSDQIGTKLREWVDKYPESYAAHTALANWFLECAWKSRGSGRSYQVSDRGWRGMSYYLEQASGCAKYACQLTDNPFMAWYVLAGVASTQGCSVSLEDIQNKNYPDWYKDAINANPSSYVIRQCMIYHLRTEWGRSEEQMLAFLRQQQDSNQLSSNDMQNLWVVFHVNMSHYATYFLENHKLAIERAEMAAAMREIHSAQLFTALVDAKAPIDKQQAALDRLLLAAEKDPLSKIETNFYGALCKCKDCLTPYIPRLVEFLQRSIENNDYDAAIYMARLKGINKKWNIPDPLPILKELRENGNIEAAELIVCLQELDIKNKTTDDDKIKGIIEAADLGSAGMCLFVYTNFDKYSKKIDLPRSKRYS